MRRRRVHECAIFACRASFKLLRQHGRSGPAGRTRPSSALPRHWDFVTCPTPHSDAIQRSEHNTGGYSVSIESDYLGMNLIGSTASVVKAYVSKNSIRPSDLPELISSVHGAIGALANSLTSSASNQTAVVKPTSSQIRKSVRHDGLISFIDGNSYKTLKRHLTSHGLDPNSYRERYGLPADYPMVAQSYSSFRSSLAKSMMLGSAEPHADLSKGAQYA